MKLPTPYLVVIISPLIMCVGLQTEGLGARAGPPDQAVTAQTTTAKPPTEPRRSVGSPSLRERTVLARGRKQAKSDETSRLVDPLPAHKRGYRKGKIHKQNALKAVVQPRQELLYHGVLEDSQRYDPRLNSKIAGVPNPQTPELIHEHFQELDRNQDGMIDPVERAFGRLDMDRDLDSHRPR